MLPVLAPKTVILPRIDVAVWVKGWNENPIIVLKELGHRLGFTVGGDEGIGDIIHRRRTNPFAGMRTPDDDDGFARRDSLFRVGRVHTNAKRRYVPAFVRNPDTNHADVGWEERMQKAHPRVNDRERLVVAEEDVSLIGRGAEVRTE